MAGLLFTTFAAMIVVAFPPSAFKIKQEKGKDYIFDPIRKKWLVLTPEEWVRQNFIQYLIQKQNYPASLIGLEKEIWIGELKKRFDVIVCDADAKPWMLIECKAMDVPLSIEVAEQALRYNQTVQAKYMVVTNGTYTRCFQLHSEVKEINEMPVW
jgi:hypothetical protein